MPLRIAPARWVLIVASVTAVVLVGWGTLLLPLLGLEMDEAMFLRCLYAPKTGAAWFSIFHHTCPSMMMSYLGAFKSCLYAPVLLIHTPSLWIIRMPMILAAALTILVLGWFLYKLHGLAAAIVGMTLFATDSGVILTAVNDWGPVVLHNLLLTAALLTIAKGQKDKSSWLLFVGGLLLGLNLWNKALFIWNPSGMVSALLVVAPRAVCRAVAQRPILLFALGILIGAYPLLRFNVKTKSATLRETVHVRVEQLPENWRALCLTLNGQFGPVMLVDKTRPAADQVNRPLSSTSRRIAAFTPDISTYLLPLGLAACTLALIFGNVRGRQLVLFFIIADAVGWLQAATTKGAGSALHHTALFLVLWYCAIAIAFGELLKVRSKIVRVLLVLLVAGITLRSLASDNLLYANLIAYESRSPWSNAEFAFTQYLARYNLRRVIVADWGLSDQITVRTGNRATIPSVNPNLPSDKHIYLECQPPDCVIASHRNQATVDLKAWTDFESFIAREHLRRVNERTFSSTHGTPEIETFNLLSVR